MQGEFSCGKRQISMINKRKAGKNWLAALLVVVVAAFMIPATAFAFDNEHTFLVSTADEFLAAVEAVNRGSGDYEISLQSDIAISDSDLTDFTSNTVTIIGNGHTLATRHGLGCKGKNTTVNLGKPDGTDILTLKQCNFYNCIAYAQGGKLNVYDGVTLRDATTYGNAGGIQLNGAAECHMYGGAIINCQEEMNACAGGVLVDEDSAFYMHGGSITNCQGGVWVQYSKFYMQGGEIKNCTADLGAGVVLYLSEGFLSGGEISGNTAKEGGGVYLESSADISQGIKIYNNTATVGGDDIYFSGNYDGNSFLTLGDTPSGLILQATGQAIDGWYMDSPRWTADQAQKYDPVNPISTEVYLKAAHGLGTTHGGDEPHPDVPYPEEPADVPQTGDNSNIAWWLVMALVSGIGLAGAMAYNRKRA